MKSNFELCREAFDAINEYKRSRSMAETARSEGKTERAIFHELKTYKAFDRLELIIRGIQQNERHVNNEEHKEDVFGR